jgi:restriction system protein
MPVPDYQTLMLPVLEGFAAGCERVQDLLPELRAEFGITEEEAAELLPSGTSTYLANRDHWARTYLSKAGLLRSPLRGRHEITEAGRRLLDTKPSRIDNSTLAQIPEFADWRSAQRSEDTAERPNASGPVPIDATVETPEEVIARAHRDIEAALASELLELVQQMDPLRFESLILELLRKMGYGTGPLGEGRLTPVSGDGGFDGIIHEDALGLDAVYIQAKRYAAANTVGRPAIQAFVGALTGEGATKGVFVTSSDFSREAREFISRVSQRVVLIDGKALARLMIAHEIGVRRRETYVLSRIDEDWFAEAP